VDGRGTELRLDREVVNDQPVVPWLLTGAYIAVVNQPAIAAKGKEERFAARGLDHHPAHTVVYWHTAAPVNRGLVALGISVPFYLAGLSRAQDALINRVTWPAKPGTGGLQSGDKLGQLR
jgi:hypothetical protein